MNSYKLFIILSLFVGVCLNFTHHQKLRKFHLKFKKINPPRFAKHFIDHGDRHLLNPKVFNYKSHNGMFDIVADDPQLNIDQKEIMDLKEFYQSLKKNCSLSDEEDAENQKEEDALKIKDDTYDYFDDPKDPHCFLPNYDEKAALRKWILNKIFNCDNSDIEKWDYKKTVQSSSSSSSSDSSSSEDESTPIQNYGILQKVKIFQDDSDSDDSSDDSMELFIGQDPILDNEIQIVVKSESVGKQEQLLKVLQEGQEASNYKPHRQEPCSKEFNDAEHYWFAQKQVPLQECFIESLTMTAFEEIFSESSEALAYVKELADTHFQLEEKSIKISVTGHSFGASVATLIAQRILKQCQTWTDNENHRPICELKDVYLFGSPRVGSAGFVEIFNTQMTVANVNVFRITNNYDQFIRLPYFKDGYRHVGQQVFYQDEQHQPKFCGEYSIMNDAKEHIGRGQGELDNHCNWDEEITEPDLINQKFEISYKKEFAMIHNNYFEYRNECQIQ